MPRPGAGCPSSRTFSGVSRSQRQAGAGHREQVKDHLAGKHSRKSPCTEGISAHILQPPGPGVSRSGAQSRAPRPSSRHTAEDAAPFVTAGACLGDGRTRGPKWGRHRVELCDIRHSHPHTGNFDMRVTGLEDMRKPVGGTRSELSCVWRTGDQPAALFHCPGWTLHQDIMIQGTPLSVQIRSIHYGPSLTNRSAMS